MKPAPKCRHAIAKSGTLRLSDPRTTRQLRKLVYYHRYADDPAGGYRVRVHEELEADGVYRRAENYHEEFQGKDREYPSGPCSDSYASPFYLYSSMSDSCFSALSSPFMSAPAAGDAAYPVSRGVLDIAVLERHRFFEYALGFQAHHRHALRAAAGLGLELRGVEYHCPPVA